MQPFGKITENEKPIIDPDSTYLKLLKHIRRILKNEEPVKHVFGIEKATIILLAGLQMLLPSTFIRWLTNRLEQKKRKITIDIYAVAKVILLFIILFNFNTESLFIRVLAIYFLIDVLTYHLNRLFLSSLFTAPVSINRNVILLFVNIIEVICSYAVLYLGTSSAGNFAGKPIDDGMTALYFSFLTFTTVGYGDYMPISTTGEIISICEAMTAYMFISTIIVNFVSRMVRSN
jgi:hypothetical protein